MIYGRTGTRPWNTWFLLCPKELFDNHKKNRTTQRASIWNSPFWRIYREKEIHVCDRVQRFIKLISYIYSINKTLHCCMNSLWQYSKQAWRHKWSLSEAFGCVTWRIPRTRTQGGTLLNSLYWSFEKRRDDKRARIQEYSEGQRKQLFPVKMWIRTMWTPGKW